MRVVRGRACHERGSWMSDAAPRLTADLYREMVFALAQQGTLFGIGAFLYAWMLARSRSSAAKLLPALGLILLAAFTLYNPINLGVVGQFDARRIVIAFAALDLPLPHALAVAVATSLLRLAIGGPAALAGVCNIWLSFALARLFARLIRQRRLRRDIVFYAMFGISAGPTYMLAQILFMPQHPFSVMLQDGTLAVTTAINIFACCAFGLIVDHMLERGRQARALADNAIAMQRVLHGATHGIAIHDGLKPLFVNETFARMHGFETPQALLRTGTLAPLLVAPTGTAITDAVLWAAAPPDGLPRFERDWPARRANGTQIWMDVELRRTIWNGKEALQTIAVDVTEAHRAAELLQARRAMLERHQAALLLLLRLPLDGSLSPDEIVTHMLPVCAAGMQCERVTLWQADIVTEIYERLGSHSIDDGVRYDTARFPARSLPGWTEVHANGMTVVTDLDGHAAHELVRLFCERTQGLLLARFPVDSRHRGLLAFSNWSQRDWVLEEQIFARAAANIVGLALLSSLRQKNFASLDAVVDAIVIFDRGNRILYGNRAAYDQVGLGSKDPFDEHAIQLLPALPEAGEGETTHVVAWTRLDGSNAKVRVARNLLPDGGSIVIWRDVTAELESQQEREELRGQLAQAAKMEAVGRLAGGIAHDFNNMLGAIIGFAGFLADDLAEQAELQSYARKILTVSDRAKQLVAQVLAFSNGRDVPMETLDLRDVAQEAREMLRGLLPAAVDLTLSVPESASLVCGNAGQLQQVIVNLCVNARDALPQTGGGIVLSIERVRAAGASPLDTAGDLAAISDAHLVHGRLEPDAVYIRLRVQDNGAGMSQDVLERIFEPFFTSKERGRGTGLGLAVVHGLLAGHRAAYAVASKAGRGTVFAIFLPQAADAAQERPVPLRQPPADSRSLSVLLVDDEPELLEAMAIGLQRLGLSVAATTEPQQAISWIASQPGRFDVLVTDQVMPAMRGTALIGVAKRADPALRVILTTGYSDGATEETALAAGADLFVLKPVPPETVAHAVHVLLA
jgi:signal transduction histidine kinase/CheY-like chemotaxis protein